MSSVYALNLFDLAPNDDYRTYSQRSLDTVRAHGGSVVALGRFARAQVSDGAEPRQAMILVEWASAETLQGFLDDPAIEDLHALRENGTQNYLWWVYDRIEDLRPLFAGAQP